MLVQRYQLHVFLPPNSVIYMPIYTACVNLERAKFLKIHLEMEWVDLAQLLLLKDPYGRTWRM